MAAARPSVIDEAFERHPRLLEPVYGLFSGGHDSLAACHAASRHPRFAGVVHIATGIGVPETREFVRDTARAQGWPLLEYETPPAVYDRMVAAHGFPGPGAHGLMYRNLKERRLRELTRDLKNDRSRTALVALVSGVRSAESERRMRNIGTDPISQDAGRVFIGPIAGWTKLDVNRYLHEQRLPRSPIVDLIHKSGECLCGAFAKPGELDDLRQWFPHAAARIDRAAELAIRSGQHAVWGTRPPRKQLPGQLHLLEPGPLCAGCKVA